MLDSRLRESRFAPGVSWPRSGRVGLSRVHGCSASWASRFKYDRYGHWVCRHGGKIGSTSQNPGFGSACGFAHGRGGADIIVCRFADEGRNQHVEMLRSGRKLRVVRNARERVRSTTQRPNNWAASPARLDNKRALPGSYFGSERSRATGECDNKRAGRAAHQCATKTHCIGGLQPTGDPVLLLGLAQRRYTYRLCCGKPEPSAPRKGTPLAARVIPGSVSQRPGTGESRCSAALIEF